MTALYLPLRPLRDFFVFFAVSAVFFRKEHKADETPALISYLDCAESLAPNKSYGFLLK